MTDKNLFLRAGSLFAEVTTQGANLLSLKRGTREIMWQGKALWPNRGGFNIAFPFFSTPGRAFLYRGKSFAIDKHGFCRKRSFAVAKATERSVLFVTESDAKTIAAYPFPFRLELGFALREDGIDTSYAIYNTGNEEMFFALASHPGFALAPHDPSRPYSLRFSKPEAHSVYMPDADGVMLVAPNSPIKGDSLELTPDIFAMDGVFLSKDAPNNGFESDTVSLVNPEGRTEFRLNLTGFRGLGIWSKPDKGDPANGRLRYVCLEPVSGLVPRETQLDATPDRELSQIPCLMRLAPGQSYRAGTSLFMEPAS